MKILRFLILLLITGCVTPLQVPPEFTSKTVETPDFDFMVMQKITQPNKSYKIYIEGDGYAFNAYGEPTTDPTPHGTLVRQIAFGDLHPNVVYMARACQFVQHKLCTQKYWTTARFAPEIITAQADAVKQIIGNNAVTLVGFSGGAQIAGLIAVTHPEIKVQKIITIAGNLDHPAWTKHHRVPPLSESADLNDYREELAQIEQTHYVGTEDTIMPPFLNENFVNDTHRIVVVKGADHNSGWDSVIPEIRNAD